MLALKREENDACTSLVMVELPCFVGSKDTAMQLLGGDEYVSRCIQKRSLMLPLRYSAVDPLRQNIMGKREATSGLLVRIKRKRSRSEVASGAEGRVTTEIVGRISTSYHFTQPADYQFLPASIGYVRSDSEKDRLYSSSSSSSSSSCAVGEERVILEAVPRPFSRVQKRNDLPSMFTVDTQKHVVPNRAQRRVNILAKAGDTIPSEPPANMKKPKWRGQNQERTAHRFIALLNELFARRPVWGRKQLEQNIILKSRFYLVTEIIPLLSFNFTTGPLKGLWSRWAYDPALHPMSRHFQIVNVRISGSYFRELGRRLWEHLGRENAYQSVDLDKMIVYANDESEEALGVKKAPSSVSFYLFNTLIKRQFTFQICNLTDDGILEFVSKALRLETWNKSTGWYSAEVLKHLRQRIIQTLFERVKIFTSEPRNVSVSPHAATSSLSSSSSSSSSSTTTTAAAASSSSSLFSSSSSSSSSLSSGSASAFASSIFSDSSESMSSDTFQKVSMEFLGYTDEMATWQERYTCLPDLVGNAEEIAENNLMLYRSLDPEFRDAPIVVRKRRRPEGKEQRPRTEKEVRKTSTKRQNDKKSLAEQAETTAAPGETQMEEDDDEEEDALPLQEIDAYSVFTEMSESDSSFESSDEDEDDVGQ